MFQPRSRSCVLADIAVRHALSMGLKGNQRLRRNGLRGQLVKNRRNDARVRAHPPLSLPGMPTEVLTHVLLQAGPDVPSMARQANKLGCVCHALLVDMDSKAASFMTKMCVEYQRRLEQQAHAAAEKRLKVNLLQQRETTDFEFAEREGLLLELARSGALAEVSSGIRVLATYLGWKPNKVLKSSAVSDVTLTNQVALTGLGFPTLARFCCPTATAPAAAATSTATSTAAAEPGRRSRRGRVPLRDPLLLPSAVPAEVAIARGGASCVAAEVRHLVLCCLVRCGYLTGMGQSSKLSCELLDQLVADGRVPNGIVAGLGY